ASWPYIGVNDHGFAIVNAYVGDWRLCNGELMYNALLSCSTVAGFLLQLASYPQVDGSGNFSSFDSTGAAIMVEINQNQHWVFDANDTNVAPDGYIIRTNYCLSGGTGNGQDRYDRLVALSDLLYNVSLFDTETFLQVIARDFSTAADQPLSVPYPAHMTDNSPYGYIATGSSVARWGVGSTVVIKGILDTDTCVLPTMWTILGHPSMGIAVPVWPGVSLPSVLVDGGEEGNNAPMCALSNSFEATLFDWTNVTYLDTYKLRNSGGTGLWDMVFPWESSAINAIDSLFTAWETNPPDSATVDSIQAAFADSAFVLLSQVVLDTTAILEFSGDVTSGAAPLQVTFEEETLHSNSVITFQWDFDNDGVADSTGRFATWTYVQDSVYTVSMIVYYADGTQDTLTKTDYIDVGTVSNETFPSADSNLSIYPNPFNPETSISFAIDEPDRAEVRIYDIRGRLVKTVFTGNLNKGEHLFIWNGIDNQGKATASGVYFCRLKTKLINQTRKLLLLK
ncbi:MAG: T9SS type A sorting domain-containing protein, partial [Candidatus Cloacimonetes bacterium]|nr:T9SS type A sorting domain-containing protein [Candidatus Cloacimonadota bacterium]